MPRKRPFDPLHDLPHVILGDMLDEVLGVGYVEGIDTVRYASTGKTVKVSASNLLALDIAVQRIHAFRWTPRARLDMKILMMARQRAY